MLPDYQALSWVVLCPIAIVTNCIGAMAISHYRSAYIGTDMVLIMLLLTMALNAGVLLLIPAVFVMLNVSWTPGFCLFYTWTFGFLRSMSLIGLFVLSFHWSNLSKMTPLSRVQTSNFPVKGSLIVTVLTSVVVGILPLVCIMMRVDSTVSSLPCLFLTYDAHPTLAIFIIILILVVFFAIIICLTDSGILLHSYRAMFLVKYRSTGYYDTERAHSAWGQSGLVSDTYSEINNTFDLWRVVLLQFLLSTLINHIPYLCIEFVQLFSRHTITEVLMLTVQWLQMMECMLFPYTLLMGTRYRHAMGHICRYIFLCDRSVCEKESTCKLQSYRLKAHIQEHNQKIYDAIIAKQKEGKTPVKNGLMLPIEEESSLSAKNQSTTTEVQADVHIHSNSPIIKLIPDTPRRKLLEQSPANMRLNLERTNNSLMLPHITHSHVATTALTTSATTTTATKSTTTTAATKSTTTMAVVDSSPYGKRDYEKGFSSSGNNAPTDKIKPILKPLNNLSNNSNPPQPSSKASSPVNSDSDSRNTFELFDEDDIAAILDNSPPPSVAPKPLKQPPLPQVAKTSVIKAKIPPNKNNINKKTENADKANTTTANNNNNNNSNTARAAAINSSSSTSMASRIFGKSKPNPPHTPPLPSEKETTQMKVWSSKPGAGAGSGPPNTPTGISFNVHGNKPYFEPVSEECSSSSDDTQPRVLQAAALPRSKPPYVRSESFLQAVSSNSAYGSDVKPPQKFKLFSKLVMSYNQIFKRGSKTSSHELEQPETIENTTSNSNTTLDKFVWGKDDNDQEMQPRYIVTDQPLKEIGASRFHIASDSIPLPEITQKTRKKNDVSDTSDMKPIKDASIGSPPISHPYDDQKKGTKKEMKGFTNLGADLFDSVNKTMVTNTTHMGKSIPSPQDKVDNKENSALGKYKKEENEQTQQSQQRQQRQQQQQQWSNQSSYYAPLQEARSVRPEQQQQQQQQLTPLFKRKLPVLPPNSAKTILSALSHQQQQQQHQYQQQQQQQKQQRFPLSSHPTIPPPVLPKPITLRPQLPTFFHHPTPTLTTTTTTSCTGPSSAPLVPLKVPPPPPLPPPPPPLPPMSYPATPRTASASLCTDSPRSVRSEVSEDSRSRLLTHGSDHNGRKRQSLITTDMLASHEIVKRLRSHAEKQTETVRNPYARVESSQEGSINDSASTSGDYEKLFIDLNQDLSLLPTSHRMYRSVSDESIFSHMGSETKEIPPSLTKATDDLSKASFSDINQSLFWPNLKDKRQGTRSANDLHLISYRPPVPPRSIPVQKVKALQATSPVRSPEGTPKFGGNLKSGDIDDLSDIDSDDEKYRDAPDTSRSPKIINKIGQDLNQEKADRLCEELTDLETLRSSPIFIRKLEKGLNSMRLSAERVEKPLMAEAESVQGPRRHLPKPHSFDIDDGSLKGLRKFLAEATAERSLSPRLEDNASNFDSPFETPLQSPARLPMVETWSRRPSSQKDQKSDPVVDVKMVV